MRRFNTPKARNTHTSHQDLPLKAVINRIKISFTQVLEGVSGQTMSQAIESSVFAILNMMIMRCKFIADPCCRQGPDSRHHRCWLQSRRHRQRSVGLGYAQVHRPVLPQSQEPSEC